MLSYQHEYHAGNHADIFKHICLIEILQGLCKKDKPFTVIDTHASAGRFAIKDERLEKTRELHNGFERLFEFYKSNEDRFPEGAKNYMEAEIPYFEKGFYAGSAELERLFMRDQDKLHLTEKHPTAFESLNANCSKFLIRKEGEEKSSVRATIHNDDSYKILMALTPPLIKRGLIICDPSFEDKSDYETVAKTLSAAHKKWNTGIIMLWYPLIARRKNETAQMLSTMENAVKMGTNPCTCFRSEFELHDPHNLPEELSKENGSHLYGSGIFMINPPWQLEEKLNSVSSFLKFALK